MSANDIPNCPVCEEQGRPGYPLHRQPNGSWWCRRGQHFVSPGPRLIGGHGHVTVTPEMAAEWLRADEEGRPYRRAIDPSANSEEKKK